MLFKIIYLLVLMQFVCAENINTELKPIPKDLADKQGCYIEEIKDVIPFLSATAPVGICKRINCFEDKLTIDKCDSITTDDPKCFITDIDYSRPFPKCCPTVECDLEVSQI